MKLKITILAILFSAFSTLQAQVFFEKGIIVTTKGDTLEGFIADSKHSDLPHEIRFKKQKMTHLNATHPMIWCHFSLCQTNILKLIRFCIQVEKALTPQHFLRAEFDLALQETARVFQSVVRVGYQFRFH